MTAPVTGFDLDTISNVDVEKVTFKVSFAEDADGNSLAGFIIVGKNSSEYQQNATKLRQQAIQKAAKRNKTVDTSTDEGAAIVANTIVSNEHQTALAVTVDWYGFNVEGAPATFDRTKADALLTKFPTWQSKILTALDNDANFTMV